MGNRRKKTNPAGVLVALLMLILVIVAIVIVLRSRGADNDGKDTPTPPATQDVLPPSTGTPAPPETPSPTPSPTAEPSSEPTPEPTPAPTPEPVLDADGSFGSDTGSGLEIVVDWTVEGAAQGDSTLTIKLSAESYSLFCREIWHGASLTIAGNTYTFDTDAIEYEGPGFGSNELGTLSVTLPAGTLPGTATVVWRFQGSYGGETLDEISAVGEIG